MEDPVNIELTLIVIGVFTILLFAGGIKTFQRSLVGAILCLVLLFPIWVIWAFFEIFTGDIKKA
jgi:succinate-acetate transporter protein